MQAYRHGTIGIKKTLQHRCFLDSKGEIFKNSYFEEHLWTTASESFSFYVSLNVFPGWTKNIINYLGSEGVEAATGDVL